MKINLEGLQDTSKLQFLIIERWQGMDPTATYRDQAHAVRRALDAVEYVENAFEQGIVVVAHKEASAPVTFTIVAVDNLEQLNDYLKGNVAHARMRPESRSVIPLSDWESGRATFERTIDELQRLAVEEEQAMQDGAFRPFEHRASEQGSGR